MNGELSLLFVYHAHTDAMQVGEGKRLKAAIKAYKHAKGKKKRGMTLADLIKFLVTRPDRRRKKKSQTKKSEGDAFKGTKYIPNVPIPPASAAKVQIEVVPKATAAAATPEERKDMVVLRRDASSPDGYAIARFKGGEPRKGERVFLLPDGADLSIDNLHDVTENAGRVMKEVKEKDEKLKHEKREKESLAKDLDIHKKKDSELTRAANRATIYNHMPQTYQKLQSIATGMGKKYNAKETKASLIEWLLEHKEPTIIESYHKALAFHKLTEKDLHGAGKVHYDVFGAPKIDMVGSGSLQPLSTDEIDSKMSQVPGFQGAIARDSKMTAPADPKTPVSWVMNMDPEGQPGSHWVAVMITPSSLEYVDSFGDEPPVDVRKRIVEESLKVWPENPHKTFKVNRVPHQDSRTASCGYHAMKFIHDRLSGKTFPQATQFGQGGGEVHQDEKAVRAFAQRYPKFVQIGKGILDHPGDNMPYRVKRMIEKHGEEPIKSIVIGRQPISSAIRTALNVLSGGTLSDVMKKYNYEQLYHLFIIVNGSLRLEKNSTVEFTTGAMPSKAETQAVTVPTGTKVADLFKRAKDPGFWRYSSADNNCQDFIIKVLGGIGALSEEARKFVKQDVKQLMGDLGALAKPTADLVTDVGARVENLKDKAREFFDSMTGKGQEVKHGPITPLLHKLGLHDLADQHYEFERGGGRMAEHHQRAPADEPANESDRRLRYAPH